MTRIFTEGLEFGDMLAFDTATGKLITTSPTPRSGSYAIKTSNGASEYTFQKNFTAVDEIYIRMGFNIVSASTGYLMALRNSSTYIGGLKYDTTNSKMLLYLGNPNGGTLIGTGTISISTSVWYLLEWHLKVSDSVGVSQVKIDGVMDIDFSGDTKPSTQTQVDNWYTHYGSGWADTAFDDFAFNTTDNTDGKNDNSWCGEGKIELLKPNGNGNVSEWTGSDGNSTDNYALVDDIPASSSDYVQDSTAGNQDAYTLEDFTGTNKSILRVWAEARAIDTVPEGAQMKIGVRTNSVDYLSDAKTLLSTYTPIKGTEYKVNPNDSAAWEDADLDGLELVLETV
jgi:hypothetical protein